MENNQYRLLMCNLFVATSFLVEGDTKYFALVLAGLWLIGSFFK